MGFLDNVRSHFKNNEEEEFERAFREGTWPEGVDDFAPLANTGSFLPATFDIDPLADESLPGNALHAAAQAPAAPVPADGQPGLHARGTQPQSAAPAAPAEPAAAPTPAAQVSATAPAVRLSPEITIEEPVIQATDSVVRAAATSMYAAPVAQSPFQVIDASLQPRTASDAGRVQQGPADATVQSEPVAVPGAPRQAGGQPIPVEPARPSGYAPTTPRYEMGDEGVQVYTRPAGERPARAAQARPEAKPFADRLRERVAAASATVQAGGAAPAPRSEQARPARRSESASDAELDAELEERRRTRRAAQARIEREAREARGSGDARAVLESRDAQARMEPAARATAERGARQPGEAPTAPRPAPKAAPAFQAGPAPVARPVPMSPSVVRPRTYDDVREIAQGVLSEHRPTVLVLKGCTGELARRVLDFSFGVCCAAGATMREFGDHAYVVLPRGTTLADEDIASLRRQGIVR